jgi:F-type H+-transporting ATPase subunit b
MDLDTKQIISQIIAFLIMLWILKRFAWKPLLQILEERRQHIKSEFEAIDQQKQDIRSLQADYEANLKEIDAQARARLQEGVNEGRKISEDIQQSARKQSQEMIKKAQDEINQEVAIAKTQLKDQVVELAMQATGKIIQKSMDPAKQKELVNEFLKEAEFK